MIFKKSGAVADTSDREIVLTRVFDAPRERVWEVWTTREQLEVWWGPNGFTTTTQEFSFKPETPEIEHATKGAKQGWTMTLDQLAAHVQR